MFGDGRILEAVANSFLSSGTCLPWARSAFNPGFEHQVLTTTTHPAGNWHCVFNFHSFESFGYAWKHCEIRANMCGEEDRAIFCIFINTQTIDIIYIKYIRTHIYTHIHMYIHTYMCILMYVYTYNLLCILFIIYLYYKYTYIIGVYTHIDCDACMCVCVFVNNFPQPFELSVVFLFLMFFPSTLLRLFKWEFSDPSF